MLTSGVGYHISPQAFVGGEVFYEEEGFVGNFTIGETVTSGTTTGRLVDHDKGANKLIIANYKLQQILQHSK